MTSEDPSSPQAKLRHSLSVPLSSPPVSHFLFSSKHTLFHPAPSPAPAFQHSVSTTLTHSYRSLHSNAAGSVNMAFIPVGILHDVVIGYTIVRSSDGTGDLLKGRFAAGLHGEYAVNVVHGLSKEASGIVSVHRRHAVNVRRFFTVPNETYSFERMPNKVLALIENVEYRMGEDQANASLLAPMDAQQDLMDFCMQLSNPKHGEDSDAPSAPFTAGKKSGGRPFDWFDTRFRTPPTTHEDIEGELEVYRQGRDVGVDAFDMVIVKAALDNVQETLQGDFFSPRICTDIFDVRTGFLETSATGEMRARGTQTSEQVTRGTIEMAAFVYFSTAVSVGDRSITYGGTREKSPESTDASMTLSKESWSGDGNVLNNAATCEEIGFGDPPDIEEILQTELPMFDVVPPESINFETELPLGQHNATPAKMAFQPIAPAPALAPSVALFEAPVPQELKEKQLDEETLKIKKREAKKRYNRISAAKSSAKKKERIERQMKELEELKQKVPELREREEALKEENAELRKKVAS